MNDNELRKIWHEAGGIPEAHSEHSLAMVGAQAGVVPVAWMTKDGRVVSDETKRHSLHHATAKAYSIPLYAAPIVDANKWGVPDVDWLANVIRAADGNHSLGAGAIAEKIVEAMLSAAPAAPVAADEKTRIPEGWEISHFGVMDHHSGDVNDFDIDDLAGALEHHQLAIDEDALEGGDGTDVVFYAALTARKADGKGGEA